MLKIVNYDILFWIYRVIQIMNIKQMYVSCVNNDLQSIAVFIRSLWKVLKNYAFRMCPYGVDNRF